MNSDLHPVTGIDGFRAVERQAVGIFGDHDLGQKRLGRDIPLSIRCAGAGA